MEERPVSPSGALMVLLPEDGDTSPPTVTPTSVRTPSVDDPDDPDLDQDPEDSSLTHTDKDSKRKSSRDIRNQAEKNRRLKLATLIKELSTLVCDSPTKITKTSTLRLSCTYIRQHTLLREYLQLCRTPIPMLDSTDWSREMLDDGILIILTGIGTVVFVSPSVERVLGHLQTELFGHNIAKIILPEDRNILKDNLLPDQDPHGFQSQEVSNEDSCSSGDTVTFSGSSCSDQSCGRPVSSGSSMSVHSTQSSYEKQRRSFCIRFLIRSSSKSTQAQYEYFNVSGFLRVPKSKFPASGISSRMARGQGRENQNDIHLIAVAKLVKEMEMTTLIEACKDEYVTKHTPDGKFIYSDHRIAQVSGYLSADVIGVSAFNYMHKDDVKWVLVATRQMFIRDDGYGRSCYRLKTKTGDFVYMRTVGHLETNINGLIESFVCINTLITEDEWTEEFRLLKQRFTPMIEDESEAGLSALTSALEPGDNCAVKSPEHSVTAESDTKDPEELNLAIQILISDVNSVNPKIKESPKSSPSPCSVDFTKTQMSDVHVYPPTPLTINSPVATTPSPRSKPVELLNQDRPSVLRVNHSSTDTVSVVHPNSLSPNSQPRRKSVVSHSSHFTPEMSNEHYISAQELSCSALDERLQSPTNSDCVVVESIGVLRRSNAGVVVKRKAGSENKSSLSSFNSSGGKRLRGLSPISSHPYSNSSTLDTSSTSSSLSSSPSDLNPTLYSISSFSCNDSSLTPDVPDQSHTDFLEMVVHNHHPALELSGIAVDNVKCIIDQPLLQPESWSSETDVLEVNLRRNQLQLDSSMLLQDQQLSAIGHDLIPMPHHLSSAIDTNFSQLEAQCKKQQQMLETINHNVNLHLNHHVDEISTNIQQDVGV